MSDVAIWNCDFAPLTNDGSSPNNGSQLDGLTVGARFGWKCHGDIPIEWAAEQVPTLVFPKPEDSYSLAILKVVKQSPNDVFYEVTGYKPGQHAPEYVRVLQGKGTPGEIGFEATAPKWTIASVIDPKQPPQAFPSLGPWSLSLPVWFMVSVGLVLLLLILIIVRIVRKYTQRRRVLEELARHKTALPPLHQFYKDARNLRRRMHAAKTREDLQSISTDLNQEFRLYVLRRFQIPTLEWSNAAILRDLRKRHRQVFEAARDPLKRTLRELERLNRRKEIELKDVEQMQRMSLDAAESLEREAQS